MSHHTTQNRTMQHRAADNAAVRCKFGAGLVDFGRYYRFERQHKSSAPFVVEQRESFADSLIGAIALIVIVLSVIFIGSAFV